ncbi:hypothetical protein FDECE_2924 [Fusarium decemcellulare]|nr:hypothetical protein FDECE_2924 [Fusarium decemcellulare]
MTSGYQASAPNVALSLCDNMVSFTPAYSDRIATAEETSDSPAADEDPVDQGRDSREAYATEKLAVRSPASAHCQIGHFGLQLLTFFFSVIAVVDERFDRPEKEKALSSQPTGGGH